MKKERQTRLSFSDEHDIIYKLSFDKRPTRTIIYTPRNPQIASIEVI
jgi:hypothetical protein